jgi:hypothetical protein
MTVDDPCDADDPGNGDDLPDGKAADDPVRDRVGLVEARDREECYSDLRGHDQVSGRPWARAAGDQPWSAGDGGWTWKGLELDPEANRAADEGLAVRQAAEGRDAEGNYGAGGLTPAMRRVEAELEHGTLVPDTENFALKSPDRFKEKLAKMIALEPDVAPGEHVAKIHDGIRYTFVFDDQFYAASVRDAENRLTENGYTLTGRKSSWSGEEYKGINSQWRDADSGQLFEVQFHTQASWEAKQQTHESYEKIQNPATMPGERARLRDHQREVVASVTIPPGALEFPHIKKKEDKSAGKGYILCGGGREPHDRESFGSGPAPPCRYRPGR